MPVDMQRVVAEGQQHIVTFYDRDSELPPGDNARERVSGRFPVEVEAPLAARHFVVDVLREWGFEGDLIHDVALVSTELATNAVLHAGTPFSVAVRLDDSTVRVSVEDGSPIAPTMRDPDELADGGRGLIIVDALASRWGVELPVAGKVVWAELRA